QRKLTWRRLDRVSQFTVSVRAGVLWQNAVVLQRLTERKEWKFFGVLPKADPGLAAAWWTALLLRGILPAAFAIAMGVLVGAVQRGHSLAGPLASAGAIFVLLQVLSPIHQAVSANLGDRTAAWLYDRLTEACVHPPGMGHLEDPTLTSDLTVARDFDLGMTGPPLSISLDFIASGMAEMIGGVACAVILARYAWWAPIVLAGAWLATHWLLRGRARWRDRPWPHQSRGSRRLRAECRRCVHDRLWRIQLGARWSGCPRRRGAPTRTGHASRWRSALWRSPRGHNTTYARDSSPRCHVRVPCGHARAGALRSHDSRRLVAG